MLYKNAYAPHKFSCILTRLILNLQTLTIIELRVAKILQVFLNNEFESDPSFHQNVTFYHCAMKS